MKHTGTAVNVRSSIRAKETVIMYPSGSIKYDGVKHDFSTPEMHRVISWARHNRPQLYKEWVREDSAMWHSIETRGGARKAKEHGEAMLVVFAKIQEAQNEVLAAIGH
jgi:hypothetical protein